MKNQKFPHEATPYYSINPGNHSNHLSFGDESAQIWTPATWRTFRTY